MPIIILFLSQCNYSKNSSSNGQMKQKEDLFYIDKVLEGDADAFAPLVDKYKDMVFTIIVKIVGNSADAEELTQDVFLKVYHSLSGFQRKSRFSTWIYRIAYNTAISKTRRKKRVMQSLDEEIATNYSEDAVFEDVYALTDEQQKILVDKAMEKLPEQDYIMITLYYKESSNVADISKTMNLSESNVKVRLHRIRKKLQQEMNALMKKQLINRKG